MSCNGAKLERKQDFFDMDPFDNKRDYGLSEIGKRGFTSSLGFDYSGSSEYGIGGTSDYTTVRSGGSGETISPSRDLIPPPAPGLFSSSKSPLSTRSDFGGRRASPSSTKDFLSSHRRRSQISRRSPHLQQTSLNNYFDDIITSSTTPGSRGRSLSSGTFGLVANNDGKLIGYRGSIFPGAFHTESPPSSVTSTSNFASDSSNFVGGYFPGPPSSISTDYTRPSKYSLASSATSGSYASTPVYYPGREEDHTYRIRDTTSQGYEDDESNPNLDESDFTIGSSSYQPSPLPSPPGSHYHSRESDGKSKFQLAEIIEKRWFPVSLSE